MSHDLIGPLGPVGEYVVRIRGIPWACSKDDILDFFGDVKIRGGMEGIHFVHDPVNGKPSGEAYIELENAEEVEKAKRHDKGYIGSRYIEIFDASSSEMRHFLNGGAKSDFVRRGRAANRNDGYPGMPPSFGGTVDYFEDYPQHEDAYVRLRGLPFSCKEQDLYDFFQGIEIASHGIKMPLDGKFRSAGEAYIRFATLADAEKAMSKHKEKIGHRYIEIFRSNAREFNAVHVEGWVPPPPRINPNMFRQHPWMSGYGPGMAGYPGAHSAHCAYGYASQWGAPPPQHNPYAYRPPPPPEGDPYRQEYWQTDPFGSSTGGGPMRAHGPPTHRPTPYDRPQPWSGYPKLPPHTSDAQSAPPPPPMPSSNAPRSPVAATSKSNNFVFVRGLPGNVLEKDIDLFFHVKPTHIKLINDDFGCPTEAKVEFASHEDAVRAIKENENSKILGVTVELFLCSKEVPSTTANGSKDVTKRETSDHTSAPANGSNGKESNPPTLSAAEEQRKSYSFYGMVPNGFQSEFSVSRSQAEAPSTTSAASGYNPTAYSNPYYPYPYNYYNYYGQQTSTPPAAASSSGTIRKEPVNYNSR